MDSEKLSRIVAGINKALLEEDVSLEEVESVIHSITRHFLDNLTDIAGIDYFQDRLNEMIDNYVDTHFEENFEEEVG